MLDHSTWRDALIAQHPPWSRCEYANILKQNNRSGVVGVGRYCAVETRNLPEDKQRWFWLAAWSLPDGTRKRIKFSIKKYGEEQAFEMARQARREALAKLEGNFEPSAVRRLSKPRPKKRTGAQTDR